MQTHLAFCGFFVVSVYVVVTALFVQVRLCTCSPLPILEAKSELLSFFCASEYSTRSTRTTGMQEGTSGELNAVRSLGDC